MVEKKPKSEILKEVLDQNGLKTSMTFTRKAVYEAMQTYANQEIAAIEVELDAATKVLDIIINSETAEDLIAMRDALRLEVKDDD